MNNKKKQVSSYNFNSKFDGRKCDLKQKQNKSKCLCECKSPLKHHVCHVVAKLHADPTKTTPINLNEKGSL